MPFGVGEGGDTRIISEKFRVNALSFKTNNVNMWMSSISREAKLQKSANS